MNTAYKTTSIYQSDFLSGTSIPERELSLIKKLYGNGLHQGRYLSIYLSRTLLNKMIDPKLSFEEILNFKAKNVAYSISHTKNIASVAISYNVKSIGIDIEERTRKLKENAIHLFSNNKDKIDDDILLFWCKKEASFKALSEIYGIKLLSQLWIQNDSFGINDTIIGKLDVDYPIYNNKSFIRVISYIKI